MRILLAQNSLYYPAHGGGDKSNRLLIEALAARGHTCLAVARTSAFGEAEDRNYRAELAARGVEFTLGTEGVVCFERGGVEVRVVTHASLRAQFAAEAAAFLPDVILASTDDPAQLLLEPALRSEARVVYLARATLALPFGPDCAFPSEAKADRIRAADRVVGVSEYVADYVRRHAGLDGVHVPISLLEPGAPQAPDLGRFENEFVVMVNPCAVKGIGIFLALADAFPGVAFAAVPTWGTNLQDREAIARHPNVRLLDPVDDIDLLLARTRILLVPSVWAEARSRIVLEAMLRGVPVVASDVGGIPEAKLGVPYLVPVRPIEKYQARLDEQMVPVAEVPPQNIGPWREALDRLLTDRAHFSEVAQASRRAALGYAARLDVIPFETLLARTVERPKRPAPQFAVPAAKTTLDSLTPEKRRLLAIRLRQKAPAAAWFPGADSATGMRLFCFPHAGGGAVAFAGWQAGQGSGSRGLPHICPVRLPGRESRVSEAPFERMAPLVEALATAIEPYLVEPYAFFGHSMGAAVAFELARLLRRRGKAGPLMLFASAARAPQFRRNHVPPAEPTDDQLLSELRQLEGTPRELLDDPLAIRAILPALRADTSLYRHYSYTEEPALACPIRAWGGARDANICREHLEGWAEQTASSFAVQVFEGGHFFLQTAKDEVLARLARELRPLYCPNRD